MDLLHRMRQILFFREESLLTPLRKAMLREMELRGFHKVTKSAYIRHVKNFAQYFGKSPEHLGVEEIKEYLHYLLTGEKKNGTYLNTVYSALKFLYLTTLQRDWNWNKIPRIKREQRLPSVLSQSEIQDIFNSVENLKHKTILMTIYAAGLRVSEAANLKVTDIDSKNTQIHVSLGKGKKDRYCLLAETNLEMLRTYFKHYKPVNWLFPGKYVDSPISVRSIQHIFEKARVKAGY